MIHYSCDRCRVPLDNPVEVATNPAMTLKDAKKGITMLLPMKTSAPGYSFFFAHLCESCLGKLAAWKNERKVDQSQVYDH